MEMVTIKLRNMGLKSLIFICETMGFTDEQEGMWIAGFDTTRDYENDEEGIEKINTLNGGADCNLTQLDMGKDTFCTVECW